MKSIVLPERHISIVNKVVLAAKENNFDAYIVGGFVRDLFLDREPKDLDIMVRSKNETEDGRFAGINFSKILAKKYSLRDPVVFERFGTSKLFIDNEEIEFVMPRKEYYDSGSRNPDTTLGSLEQDALRRDFTINALFLRLSDMTILDFTSNGVKDIKNKTIRATEPKNAEIIFRQDPLRILRAARQSLQLRFSIEPLTYNAMKISAKRIDIVSPERIRDELNKIVVEPNPSKAFLMMDNINLLQELLPELARLKNLEQPTKYHADDVFTHSLKVLDRTRNDVALRMAALLHDIGKFKTYKKDRDKISFLGHDAESAKEAEVILKRLKYAKDFIGRVCSIIKNHMYPKMYTNNWSDGAIRRFVKRCGNEFNLAMEISKADYGKKNDENKLAELTARIEDLKLKNALYPKDEMFSGKELMEIFDKPAGKWIQIAKNKIEELQIENPSITKNGAIKAVKDLKIF
ncbi:MAG: CCA tRNA nucleotidyltransferase [Endomicrobium sp.]|jgi:putative nucleotidyltransferase with HDIG domain|nr:CCA tRNA nucleotidyltransferase [Endomicrobium sp.]